MNQQTRSFWGAKAFQFIPLLHSFARATRATIVLTEEINNYEGINDYQKVTFTTDGEPAELDSFYDLYDTAFALYVALTDKK